VCFPGYQGTNAIIGEGIFNAIVIKNLQFYADVVYTATVYFRTVDIAAEASLAFVDGSNFVTSNMQPIPSSYQPLYLTFTATSDTTVGELRINLSTNPPDPSGNAGLYISYISICQVCMMIV